MCLNCNAVVTATGAWWQNTANRVVGGDVFWTYNKVEGCYRMHSASRHKEGFGCLPSMMEVYPPEYYFGSGHPWVPNQLGTELMAAGAANPRMAEAAIRSMPRGRVIHTSMYEEVILMAANQGPWTMQFFAPDHRWGWWHDCFGCYYEIAVAPGSEIVWGGEAGNSATHLPAGEKWGVVVRDSDGGRESWVDIVHWQFGGYVTLLRSLFRGSHANPEKVSELSLKYDNSALSALKLAHEIALLGGSDQPGGMDSSPSCL